MSDALTGDGGPGVGMTLMQPAEELAFELRAQEGAIWTGSRILIGIVAFAFAALAFAYFYLGSLNDEDLWRPHHVTGPVDIGTAVFAFFVASVALSWYGAVRMRRDLMLDWVVSGWMAFFGMMIAIGLQFWELTQLPFYPGSSGYASCFIGWSVMNIGLMLGCAYWLETILARASRLRRALVEDGGAARSKLPAARLMRANLEACMAFFVFAVIVASFFWLFFYIT